MVNDNTTEKRPTQPAPQLGSMPIANSLALSIIKGWVPDAITLLFVGLAAWLITRQYLGETLFAWGDHPGQFMRFWYPLAHAVPESGHWLWGVISWNPTWYAGYPEIQFYPPGTTLLGILLNYATFGQLSPERVYNFIPAIAFTLPLFTCYAFLRYALAPLGFVPSALAGLTAGFLAISLKPMWGGIDGVVIGLMGERLAFGFAPLVLVGGWLLVEKPVPARLATASLLLATLLLLHPFHAPALVLAVACYALARMQWRAPDLVPTLPRRLGKQFAWFTAWLLLSVGLVAWWVVPLIGHYTPYAAALVRATTDQVITWFDAGKIEWLWLAALMSLMLLAQRHPRIEATVGTLALLIPLLIGGILFNDQVLLARFNITVFDPIRFIAEYYLALILLVGCAVAAITSRFLWRIPWLAAICALVVVVTLRPYLPEAWGDLRSHTVVPSMSTLGGMMQHPAFSGYWDALRNDPATGRVFFVSNYLQLTGDDGVITPTTANSLTPYLTGREIIGGTFSHWSPVARWLWVGDPFATLLPAQVESGDSRQLFGTPWDQLTIDPLIANLTKLNVTTIVAGASDQQAMTLFDSSPRFARYWQNDHFVIYHLVESTGEWVAPQNAVARLTEKSGRRWVIEVDQSAPNATILLKMSHYPLWTATVNGQRLPLTITPDSLQILQLPELAPYTVEIEYREGVYEWSGLAITIATILAFATFLYWHRHKAY